MEHTDLQPQNLLVDFEDTYVRAGGGKRFANYIIDVIVFYIVVVCIGIAWAIISPDTIDSIPDESSAGFGLLDRLISLVLYALFMFAQEAIFKGKTIGKFITRTRALNLDGSRITSQKAMQRALSRAVPFCAFSALGTPCNPWHDKWTDTMVIDEKISNAINIPQA